MFLDHEEMRNEPYVLLFLCSMFLAIRSPLGTVAWSWKTFNADVDAKHKYRENIYEERKSHLCVYVFRFNEECSYL